MNVYRFKYGNHGGEVMAFNETHARTILREQYGHGLGDVYLTHTRTI